jgi:hypothetical protein
MLTQNMAFVTAAGRRGKILLLVGVVFFCASGSFCYDEICSFFRFNPLAYGLPIDCKHWRPIKTGINNALKQGFRKEPMRDNNTFRIDLFALVQASFIKLSDLKKMLDGVAAQFNEVMFPYGDRTDTNKLYGVLAYDSDASSEFAIHVLINEQTSGDAHGQFMHVDGIGRPGGSKIPASGSLRDFEGPLSVALQLTEHAPTKIGGNVSDLFAQQVHDLIRGDQVDEKQSRELACHFNDALKADDALLRPDPQSAQSAGWASIFPKNLTRHMGNKHARMVLYFSACKTLSNEGIRKGPSRNRRDCSSVCRRKDYRGCFNPVGNGYAWVDRGQGSGFVFVVFLISLVLA